MPERHVWTWEVRLSKPGQAWVRYTVQAKTIRTAERLAKELAVREGYSHFDGPWREDRYEDFMRKNAADVNMGA